MMSGGHKEGFRDMVSTPRHQEKGEDGEGDSDQEETTPNTAFWVLRVERKNLAESLLQNNTILSC